MMAAPDNDDVMFGRVRQVAAPVTEEPHHTSLLVIAMQHADAALVTCGVRYTSGGRSLLSTIALFAVSIVETVQDSCTEAVHAAASRYETG